ncbi:MAG: hypothetical protein HZA46_24120 [Planctomycetales bacterium]|nr:hypothetical protein [Planctomycetales bacterium]
MHDKVLNFFRRTLLHENTLEDIWIRLDRREVRIVFCQPHERYQYPDRELVLTFLGVSELTIAGPGTDDESEEMLIGIECVVSQGRYRADISFGFEGRTTWTIRMEFTDLFFVRS